MIIRRQRVGLNPLLSGSVFLTVTVAVIAIKDFGSTSLNPLLSGSVFLTDYLF